MYLALAEGRLEEKDFAAWLRTRIRPATRGEVHEPRRRYRPKARIPRSRRKPARLAR
jgi:hypothetical protein